MKVPGSRTLKKFTDRLNSLGIVLMYHRVTDTHYDPLGLNVSPQHFEEQIQVLKKYGRPVKMQRMGKNLKRFFMGTTDIAVTLDDGYADNYHHAKPILERLDVPATFFIITGSIDSQEEFFWDGLKSTVLAPETLPQFFEITLNSKKHHWEMIPSGPCQSVDYSQSIESIPPNGMKLSRFGLYSLLIYILGPLSAEERRGILKHLEQWSRQDLAVRTDYLPMTSNDLVSLAKCPLFEIGAHTVNHPCLANLPILKQEEEINQSKADLENRLNKAVVSFSYPHGSYSEETASLVKSLKFQNACTVVSKPVIRNTDPYLLPRFAVEDWNGDEFERNLHRWLIQP